MISGWTTSVVGAATPLGMVMVGLPVSASATVGSPSTGGTASPVALASGVRTLFTSITKSSVSSFFTFDELSFLARPSLGAIATSTRLPTFSPVSPVTSCFAVCLLSSTSDAGVWPYEVWISLPVRPFTST